MIWPLAAMHPFKGRWQFSRKALWSSSFSSKTKLFFCRFRRMLETEAMLSQINKTPHTAAKHFILFPHRKFSTSHKHHTHEMMEILTMKDRQTEQPVLRTTCKQHNRNKAATGKARDGWVQHVEEQAALKTKAVAISHQLSAEDNMLLTHRREARSLH